MIRKIIPLLLLVSVTFIGLPGILALPQYLDAYNTTFHTNGTCGICHVNPAGGGPRNPYGQMFENQSNYATDPSAALQAIGPAPSTISTAAVTSTSTAAVTSTSTAAVTSTSTTAIAYTSTPTITSTSTATVTATSIATVTSTATPVTTLIATPIETITATPIETVTATPGAMLTPGAIRTALANRTPTATPRTPGFGLMTSLAGLLMWFFLLRRRN